MRLAFCFSIILSLAIAVHPQAAKSELIGEVRDPNGALVANAKVSLTEVATGQTSSKVSSDGSFIMTNHNGPLLDSSTHRHSRSRRSLRSATVRATRYVVHSIETPTWR